MEVSVVIPTCSKKRFQKLRITLTSILRQNVKPLEVIIIDDCPNEDVNRLVDVYSKRFRDIGVVLKYIVNPRGPSLTSARNVGAKIAQGDIVLFLDDDVILKSNYIEEILKVYHRYPDAVGVQGFVLNFYCPRNVYLHVLHKIFMMHYYAETCKVLRSLAGTYPQKPNNVVKCEWLLGCNHSWKGQLLKRFKYDERLPGPSYGEDKDLSYRVYRAKIGSLYLTPFAKVIHLTEPKGPHTIRQVIPCKTYLMLKVFKPSLSTIVIILWHWLGYLFIRTLYFMKNRTYTDIQYIIETLKSLIITLINFSDVISGNLRIFKGREL